MKLKKSKSPGIDGVLNNDSSSSKASPKASKKTLQSPALPSWPSVFLALLRHYIKVFYALAIVAVIIVGMIYWNKYQLAQPGDNKEFITDTIITDDTELVIDMTWHLEIVILGQRQAIPNTFGKVQGGRMVINSNSDDGTIRVQSPQRRKFFLTDFFTVWEAPFNSRCIFTHCANTTRKLTMYVNREINEEYEKYQLHDGDDIRIVIESIK